MISFAGKDFQFPLAEREIFFKEILNTVKPRHYVFLNTCNRVELYFEDHKQSAQNIHPDLLFHLFSLASGLKSSLIGEQQILHQLKKAYQESITNNTVSSALHLLFQNALRVGKKVRRLTQISQGAVSHSQAAVNLLTSKNIDFSKAVITIIGVNNLNSNIIHYLGKRKANTILLGSRTFAKAKELANNLDCSAFKLDRLRDILKQTDILISATSAPHLIVRFEDFPLNKPMFVLDLAVPRDIDENIAQLKEVQLFNISDIEKTITQNLDSRKEKIKQAEIIIQEEVENFLLKF